MTDTDAEQVNQRERTPLWRARLREEAISIITHWNEMDDCLSRAQIAEIANEMADSLPSPSETTAGNVSFEKRIADAAALSGSDPGSISSFLSCIDQAGLELVEKPANKIIVSKSDIFHAAQAVCQERCADKGEPPCWVVAGDNGRWPSPACDDPGCLALAEAALLEFAGKVEV